LEPFEVGDARLGVLICFEAIFPGPARRLVGRGAAALVNITNDQLVGDGAVQQAAMATFRAVENRVPLARVSNLGPTLVVDRFGRIEKEETGEGVFTANLRSPDPGTPSIYGRYGDLFAFLCILPAAWMVVMRTRRAN
jgi:apolipoprotein N-acyltransferase